MEGMLPEILLHIFDLVVHTPDISESAFPRRTAIRNLSNQAHFAPEDAQRFRFEVTDRYPSFPVGITAHALSTESPLRLSHVCKRWRNVAFADSSLWSTIYITNGCRGFLELFKLWLSNSGTRLLKLVFRDCGMSRPSVLHGEAVADMFMLAALHHQRWSSLKIRIWRFTLPLNRISKAISPTMVMANLKALAFNFVGTAATDPANQFNAVWGRLVKNSPQLKEIQMWHTMDHDLTMLGTIPFPRLISMTLPRVHYKGGGSFEAHLAQCHCLRTLAISFSGFVVGSAKPYAITLPSLTDLYLVGTVPFRSDVSPFLQLLHLPALTTLTIHESYDYLATAQEGLWDALKVALDHWKPKLQSLSLRYRSAPAFERYFLPLLHHSSLESLSHLRVGGLIGPTFMDAITVDAHQYDSTPLPKLQAIQIESAYFGVDGGLTVKMVLSRHNRQWPY